MSTTQALVKNLIFVTGNGIGEYKELGQELALHLYKSVYLKQPCSAVRHYQTPKELASERSLFFSQVLFYGSLPSRRNIVVAAPDLSMKTILQFIILLEKIKKNVFVVVDDRNFLSPLTKSKFNGLIKKLPIGNGFFLSEFINREDDHLFDVVERLGGNILYNTDVTKETSLREFNEILENIPELFREEIRRSVFGGEFGDVPFNKLVKNLLTDFDDTVEEEPTKEDIESLKIPPKKTITDYFKPEAEKPTVSKNSNPPPPPSLNIQEPEGEFISLFEIYQDDEEPFTTIKDTNMK